MDNEYYYSLLDSIDDYRHFMVLLDNREDGHNFMVSQYCKGKIDVVRDFNYKIKVRCS